MCVYEVLRTIVHINARRSICEAASAEPGCFVVSTGALLGNHTCKAPLKSDRGLVHSVQMPVTQHPAKLQLTYTYRQQQSVFHTAWSGSSTMYHDCVGKASSNKLRSLQCEGMGATELAELKAYCSQLQVLLASILCLVLSVL